MKKPSGPPASSERRLTLPARYALDGRILGNRVQQLAVPARPEALTLVPYRLRRTDTHALLRKDGRRIVLTERKVAPPADGDEALLHTDVRALVKGKSDVPPGTWISPAAAAPDTLTLAQAEELQQRVRDSWRDRFRFRAERPGGQESAEAGLRPPQIGALHGVLAHWAALREPATVVMPTGTGKTETMLALLVAERLPRLLVIVPSDALRTQIGTKFVTLGLLKDLGALAPEALYPVVGFLEHRPTSPSDVEAFFRRCNVVVSTMSVIGGCSEASQRAMAEHCSHVFFDEAHHVRADRWQALRQHFAKKLVVQFTATPFRNDGKLVDGRTAFNYPLRKAQDEGYFRPIQFLPINEVEAPLADAAIAERAVAQLESDMAKGLSHVVMARCSTTKRAAEVHALYAKLAARHNPVLLHTALPAKRRQEAMGQLRAGKARIVTCVNMLGEGFDMPELKIAAFHDPHKSLAITLQFTGRFTRSRRDLGDATMVANIADHGVSGALQRLYFEDADWNHLLVELSEGTNAREARRSQFLEDFRDVPDDISLRNVLPKLSAVVYRMREGRWHPEKAAAALGLSEVFAGPTVNDKAKVALLVTCEQELVPWGAVRQLRNTEWHLYLLHWDEARRLLYINSSNHATLHSDLARAVGGPTVERVRGEPVFRAFHNVQRLRVTNAGLSELFNRNRRFTFYVGADIVAAMSEAQTANRTTSNLFARGYEDGERVSFGVSRKGRVWAFKTVTDIQEWVAWCHRLGTKLIDESITTQVAFANAVKPQVVRERPAQVPILFDWHHALLERSETSVELELDGRSVPLGDAELQVENFERTGPLRFGVVVEGAQASYEMRFSGSEVSYVRVAGPEVYMWLARKPRPLSELLQDLPPIVRFASGDQLEHNELFALPPSAARAPYARSKIVTWDWSGVDLTKESQKREKRAASIQRRVIERLKVGGQEPAFQIVFDDDEAGEAADVIAISASTTRFLVHLYHLKFSKGAKAGARVDDLYVVCGQAQRSIHWAASALELLAHMRRREEQRLESARKRGRPAVTRFEHGSLRTLVELMKTADSVRMDLRIFVVQPGLSRAAAQSDQLELLAATEAYLLETYGIPFGVIASE